MRGRGPQLVGVATLADQKELAEFAWSLSCWESLLGRLVRGGQGAGGAGPELARGGVCPRQRIWLRAVC